RKVEAPQLWILGEDDLQAPSAETSRRIRTLVAAGRPITLALYPGAEHGMTEYETRSDGERVSTRYSAGYCAMMRDFARTGRLRGQNALQLYRDRLRRILDPQACDCSQRFFQTVSCHRLQCFAWHGVALNRPLHRGFEQSGLVFVSRVHRTLRHSNMDGDFLHGGLLEAFFQKDVECRVQQLLVALLLLRSRRPPHARTFDVQIGRITNFLALQPKGLIMERAGTIISKTRV